MIGKKYYSQFGEDIFVNNYFGQDDGFYVDVGSYHPVQLSNTALLYERGWNGITVDVNPDMVPLFAEMRPRGTHIQAAIGSTPGTTTLYACNRASMYTTSQAFVDERAEHAELTFTKQGEVPVQTLAQLFATHVPEGQRIHVLNIDVEGSELDVLQSNDWGTYKPKMVLVEDVHFDCENPAGSQIFCFMQSQGYKLSSVYHITLIFIR